MEDEIKYFYSGDLLIGDMTMFFNGVISTDIDYPQEEIIKYISDMYVSNYDRVLVKVLTRL